MTSPIRAIRRALVLALVAIATALAVPGTASAGITSAELSFELEDRRTIRLGDHVRFSGTLDGELLGDAGRTIQLRGKPYPYGSESTVATTTTDGDGNYEFAVAPEFNTRYRAVQQGGSAAESTEEQIYVNPLVRFTGGFNSFFEYETQYRVRVAPSYPSDLDNRDFILYFRKTTMRKYRPVDVSPTVRVKPSRLEANNAFTPPFGRYRFRVWGCFDVPADVDFGLGRGVDKPCPRRPFVPNRYFDKAKTGDEAEAPFPVLEARMPG